MTRTRRAAPILLLTLLLAGAGLVWLHRPHASAVTTAEPMAAAQVVSALTIQLQPWQSVHKAYGQVRAMQGADLSSQVSGIVDEIDFQSGAAVKAGAVLMRLRMYDDPARLQQLQSEVTLYAASLARDQKQFDAQAISRATLDVDTANLRNFQAQVAAQVQVMDEKIVRAPFGGRLGIRQVNLGQYLPAGTAVVNLESLDPIYVDFNLPQQQVAGIRPGQPVAVSVDAWPGRNFQATVLAVDSRIDEQSRMATIRASLANADHALLPGMFAIVRIDQGASRPVLAVPHAAISFNPYGDFVYVLTPSPGPPSQHGRDVLVANAHVVTLGETTGDRVVVLAGLAPGDRIVTAGQSKLRQGAVVEIDNAVQPADELNPTPTEE